MLQSLAARWSTRIAWDVGWVRWSGFAAIATWYVMARLLFLPSAALLFPDSAPYLAPDAWIGGLRPATVPLFFAILADAPPAIVIAQWLVAAACWLTLACAAASVVQRVAPRLLAFAAILLFSLAPDIVRWDATVLSESLASSLSALLIAAGLWLARGFTWKRVALLLVVATLWVGTRDVHAYALLGLGIGWLTLVIVMRPGWRFACMPVAMLLLGAATLVDAEMGHRWTFPLTNVIAQRVLPDADRTDWFADHGMPASPELSQMAGTWASDPRWTADPALTNFEAWLVRDGKRVYIRYLLENPAAVFVSVWEARDQFLWPRVSGFNPIAPLAAAAVFWEVGPALAALAVVVVAVRGRVQPTRMWWVPVAVMACVVPTALVVWSGDAMELDRHALPMALWSRLGLLLLGLLTFVGPRTLRRGRHRPLSKGK